MPENVRDRCSNIDRMVAFKRLVILAILAAIAPVAAQEIEADTRQGIAPDIRDDETRLKLQRGDFVIVPVPISNPTVGSGLVLAFCGISQNGYSRKWGLTTNLNGGPAEKRPW